MIVILCEDFEDAQHSFDQFMIYLEEYSPWSIYKVWESSNCVETDENLRYIFVDRRYGEVFRNMTPDFIGVYAFFEMLEDLII